MEWTYASQVAKFLFEGPKLSEGSHSVTTNIRTKQFIHHIKEVMDCYIAWISNSKNSYLTAT